MPLKRCGSVSERFSVWLPLRSAAANCAGDIAKISAPPGSIAPTACAPLTRCIDACLRDPASVKSSVASEKSNAASPTFAGIAAPFSFHLSRPAIIRCTTRNRSASRAQTRRLPTRVRVWITFPSIDASGGSNVRTKNGLLTRARSTARPTTRGRSALRYSSTSGSSGTGHPFRLPPGGGCDAEPLFDDRQQHEHSALQREFFVHGPAARTQRLGVGGIRAPAREVGAIASRQAVDVDRERRVPGRRRMALVQQQPFAVEQHAAMAQGN